MRNLLKRALGVLRVALSETPFIGRLDFRNRAALGRAALETAVTVVVSSIPIWVAIFVLLVPDRSWERATHEVIKNGELLLLSAGAVGPLIYVVSVVYRSTDKRFLTSFPHGTFYLLFAFVVMALSTTVITLRAVQSHPLFGAPNFDMSAYVGLSWWCYVLAVFVFFTASMHRNLVESQNPLDLNKPGEETFESEWKNRDE